MQSAMTLRSPRPSRLASLRSPSVRLPPRRSSTRRLARRLPAARWWSLPTPSHRATMGQPPLRLPTVSTRRRPRLRTCARRSSPERASIHLTTGGGTTLVFANESAQFTLVGSNTPTGRALATLDNSGVIDVSATATAIVGGNDGPVTQPTTGGLRHSPLPTASTSSLAGATATAVIDNSGSLDVAANAVASGAASASALAIATGISQGASAVAFNGTAFFHLETRDGDRCLRSHRSPSRRLS